MEGSISFKKELLGMGTPTEYALTVAMRHLNYEFKDLKSLVKNGEIPKSTARRYLDNLAKLNNQLVDRYNIISQSLIISLLIVIILEVEMPLGILLI